MRCLHAISSAEGGAGCVYRLERLTPSNVACTVKGNSRGTRSTKARRVLKSTCCCNFFLQPIDLGGQSANLGVQRLFFPFVLGSQCRDLLAQSSLIREGCGHRGQDRSPPFGN